MVEAISLIAIPLAAAALAVALWRPIQRLRHRAMFEKARLQFHRQRERLEAKLVRQIAVPVVAGEVEWVDCEFDDEVVFLRERRGRRLVALVLVTLGTEPDWLEKPDEEFRRCGVAIFRFDQNGWQADPRIYMNLTPDDVVKQFAGTMELFYRETTRRR